MTTEIVVALIASAGGLLGSGAGVMASSRLTSYRIEQLEKKVEKHNNIVERTYRLEGQMENVEERLDELHGK